MAIRVALHHSTHYTYDRPINLGPQVVRLRPAPHTRTPILSYSLKVEPKDHFINWQQDAHSNYLARLVFAERTTHFRVDVDLVAEMTAINPFDFFLEPHAKEMPFEYDAIEKEHLAAFLKTLPDTPEMLAYMKRMPKREGSTIDFMVAANQQVHRDVEYLVRMEPGVQTPEETLAIGSGSCRDSAWLLAQVLRRLGLASRFVSGYLIQLVADLPALDGPSGPTTDIPDLHAWTEVYLPGAGWVGIDPTSGLFAMEGHIPLACSPEPQSAAPISGGIDPCETTLDFQMTVTRLKDDPRSTKPYTEAQWQQIMSLGHTVDERLRHDDVRLRTGGEPTFLAVDYPDAPEWNIAAVGPKKQAMSVELLERLAKRFAPGGMRHYGQGKWYPGEPLPRWALSVFWREDGQPLWRDAKHYAKLDRDYGANAETAKSFALALTKRLQLPDTYLSPAYEDPMHFLMTENRLPLNLTPDDPRLKNPEERARMVKLARQGTDHIVGYVLPLDRRNLSPTRWVTGPWPVRSSQLYLLPGDSPMGMRIMIDSLPYIKPAEYPEIVPIDPMAPAEPLQLPNHWAATDEVPAAAAPVPASERLSPQALAPTRIHADGTPVGAEEARRYRIVDDCRTALCVEPRNGRLYIFMPPVRKPMDYVELVAAVEDVAESEGMPVVIEGYTPPWDARFQKIMVTPDPGVIEVNIHPVDTWEQLVAVTEGIYEDARQTRLCAEKYQLDGRPTGSGGGAHITFGGATPQDSPFLRRPDLLRSMVGYWVNHPALSYVFSGLFIGPTSQAPRVDEARHESLYELEIAFQQVPEGGYIEPWLVDRLFRHLLTDLTGNTHRSEFCIDKLYSPDSSSGRLGIVELRGFEMPPHPRMNLAQQGLVRALLSWFWREPYKEPLKKWGQQLHDRFMLPWYLREDLASVIRDLNDAGIPMRLEWFEPHLDFRFPLAGAITIEGMKIELHTALEPWNTLGEEPGGGGTARYVDTSVERLQVRVDNLDTDRHMITCNGRPIPLRDTASKETRIGGVRFRAWQPPSCLHPTIPVHSPLVFDVIDLANGRAIGGCTYHVSHPGGRAAETRPINDREAEGRRLARFEPRGHTAGPITLPREECNPSLPHTLDLRYNG